MRKASTQRVHWALALLLCSYFWSMLGLCTAVAQSTLDETTLSNVDAQVTTSFFGLRYNRSTNTYVGFVTVTNTSQMPLPTPLYLVITAVTPGSVSVLKAQGMTLQQHPYYNLSQLLSGATLAPTKTTARLTLELRNPTNAALQVTASVFIPRPSAPPTLPPLVTLLSPSTGTLTRTPAQMVTGTVSDTSVTSATLQHNGATLAIPVVNGAFSVTLTLVEGMNTLRVSASNGAGTGTSAEVHVTLDTVPPQLNITTPPNNTVLFDPQVHVAGTVDDPAAQLSVNGQPTPVSNGQWDVPNVPLQLGPNTITVTATDAAGNISEQSLHVTRQAVVLQTITVAPGSTRFTMVGAQQPLVVTGHYSNGTTEDLTAASADTTYESSHPFVASVNAAGVVTARANGTATITAHQQSLSATASMTVEIGVTLTALGLMPATTTMRAVGATQPLHLIGTFSDGSTRDLTAATTGTTYTSSDLTAATVSSEGVVTALANGATTITAAHEQHSATAQVTVALSAGPGFLRGEVYDDTMGLPLAHVTVTLLTDGRGPLATPLVVVADARGQFLLPGMAGDAVVRLEKAGFTSVERQGTIPQNTALTLLDARLTPLAAQPNLIASALGGQARDTANTLSLDFVPGSVGADTSLQVSAISNQGLQGQLPPGWSPIATVDVQPAGLIFGQPVLLHAPNPVNLPPHSPVTMAFYDTQAHRWMVHDPAQVTADGTQIVAFITTSGQVTLLVADAAPLAPPPLPQVGQALPGVAVVPLPATLTVTGTVLPRTAPPGQGARATGRIVLETGGPLPSGTVVQTHVSEYFDLLDTSRVVPLPFIQDLLLYAQPRRGNAPSLNTTFPITPSVQFTLQELQLGTVRLDVRAPETSVGGNVVGTAGGSFTDAGGNTVEVPGGALTANTVLEIVPLSANQLPVALPSSVNVLGAVQLELGGATVLPTTVLSIIRPATLPNGAQVIIAQVVSDPAGSKRLRIVALGEVQATRIVSQTTVGTLTLPGITAAGQYVFVQPQAALGFIAGHVMAPNGSAPQALALMTADTAPFADVTGTSGTYVVAGAVGAVQVTALLQATGDTATVATSVGASNAVVPLDLTLQAVAPHVMLVSPAENARNVPLDTSILVQFSEALSPGSITASSVQLTAGSTSVAGQLRVAPDGLSVSFTPVARLTSNTRYSLTLTSAIVDLAGHGLPPFAASFTTLDTSLPRDVTGLITATAPNAQGLVTVHGTVGVAEPGQAVGVINNTTGVIVTAVANTDGSFSLSLSASTSDILTVNLRTAAGADTTVQMGSYTHANGSVTLGELGGRVSANTPDGPITLDIPTGALAGQTTIKITPMSEAETVAELARLGLALPAGPGTPMFGGALKLDAPGAFAKTKLQLSVPVPPGLEAAAIAAGRTLDQVQTTLVRVEQLEEDGQTHFDFREIDSAQVINGRLVDGEHDGLQKFIDGFYIFFPFAEIFTSYVNGRVFITDNSDPRDPHLVVPPATVQCPDLNPAIARTQKCPALEVIVRASGQRSAAKLFYSLSNDAGHYTVSVPTAIGDAIAVSARRADAEPDSAGITSIGLAPIRDLVIKRKAVPTDMTPPDVRILLSAVAVPVGTPVTLTLVATDNDNSLANLAQLTASLRLTPTPPLGGNSPSSPSIDPVDHRLKTTFIPTVAGTYQFTATAQDLAGKLGTSPVTALTVTVQASPTPPGVNLLPGDRNDKTPPAVVGIDPPRGAAGVTSTSLITIHFSEAVDRTIETLPLIQVSGRSGLISGTIMLSADQTSAVFTPAGGFEAGAMYTVQVTGVKDLLGNSLDQDPFTSDQDPFVSSFSTLDRATPVTLPGADFNIHAGRESTVVGHTLFVTNADNSIFRGRILIFDVSDPQHVLSEINPHGRPRAITVVPEFSYRGVNGTPTPPRAMLFAVVFVQLESGVSGSFLQFYDVTDPARPQPVGTSQLLSIGSIGTKIKVAGGRAFIKLTDQPNPGLAVVDLRLALIKATLLPPTGMLSPTNGMHPEGVDANNDGDFGDTGDQLPDIFQDTDVVLGRFLSPGDLTDFDVSADGNRLFIADGKPRDINNAVESEPNNPELRGPFYGVGGHRPTGELHADAAGLLSADMSALVSMPLVDVAPRDGLDDRVLVRINTPDDVAEEPSTRVRLAEKLTFTQAVITLRNGVPVSSAVPVSKDIVFVSNASAGTVTMLDVDDPRHPQRLAVIKLPQPPGGAQLQPVELFVSGTQLFVAVPGFGTLQVDLNGAVVLDQTGSQPVFRSLTPRDLDGNGTDDRIVSILRGVAGNGTIAATGQAFGGTNTTAQIASVALPRLEFVRFDGSAAELANFHPEQPGDRANSAALKQLKPVTFLNPGRLHAAPNDPTASDLGDRTDPQYVYFVRAIMPAGAAAPDGTVPLTLESLNAAGAPLVNLGYAFPPTSYNSPRPGASQSQRVLKLHRQIAPAFINANDGQRVSSLGTVYISDPIFLTREAFRQADVALPTGPLAFWPGAMVRASLVAAAQNSQVPSIYVPGVTHVATLRKVLAEAHTALPSFAGEFIDSPDPAPRLNASMGMGEAAGPVFLHNGEFTWEQTDLSIKGRGMPYTFVRRYESQSLYNGPLGRGFEFNYNIRLQEVPEALPSSFRVTLVDRPGGVSVVGMPGDVLLYDGTGRADLFRFTVNGTRLEGPDNTDPDELAADPSLGLDRPQNVQRHYQNPRGYFTKLCKLTDGTFVLLERNGSRYRFGVNGQIVSITDRNDNRLDFLYDEKLRLRAVVDTMGRLIRFGYYKHKGADDEPAFDGDLDVDDPTGAHDGKIATQVDFIDRKVQYFYDARNRLVQVTSPAVQAPACHGPGDCFPLGKTMQYDYHDIERTDVPRHSFQLATITYPRELTSSGTPRIRNTYVDGKLDSQVWGVPGTQTVRFVYQGPTTTVFDRRGSSTDYTHNSFGHAEMMAERGSGLPGSGYITMHTFNHPDGLLTLLTMPEQNTVEYKYDVGNSRQRSRGNLLKLIRFRGPRPNGNSADLLVTNYEDSLYDFRFNLMRSANDPGGLITSYQYDTRGNLRFITRPAATGIIEGFTYNAFGQVLEATDGEGNVTTYTYHAESQPDGVNMTTTPLRSLNGSTGGYLQEVVVNARSGSNTGVGGRPGRPPAQLKTTYSYRAAAGSAPKIGYVGNVTQIVDPRGVPDEFGVNELNQVFQRHIAVQGSNDGASALGYIHRIFYDANNQVRRKEIQHDSSQSTPYDYFYNLLDDVETTEVSTGSHVLTTRYFYDANQNLERVSKPELNMDSYTYEARDLRTSITRGEGSNVASTMHYTYDGNRNVRTIVDGLFQTTRIDYDGFDRKLQVIDRMGNGTQFTYDNNSLLRSVTRTGPESGQGANRLTSSNILQEVKYDYDAIYRPIAVTENILGRDPSEGGGADGMNGTFYQYDHNSRVILITNDNGNFLEQFYDGANRLIARFDRLGNQEEYVYDANGNRLQTIEREQPSGTFTSSATYDAVNRVLKTTDPMGNIRRFEDYDAQNNLLHTKDAEGNVVRYEYDLINRQTAQIQELKTGNPITTIMVHDGNSRLRRLTDDNGNTTHYDYDALDRVKLTTFPDGTTTQNEYDTNSNVFRFTDQNANVIHNIYDSNDRLIERNVSLGQRPGPVGDIDATQETYQYDGLDRLTLAQDEDTTVEMVYDSLSRVTREIQTRRDLGITYTTQNRFDGVGNRRRLTYPSVTEVQYTYDRLDRIQQVSSPLSPQLASYTYDGPARVSHRQFGNGVELAVRYDLDRRVIAMTHRGPTPSGTAHQTLFDLRYAWTPEHQRLGEQRVHQGGRVDLYNYDSVYRLTGAEVDARFEDATQLSTLSQPAPDTLPLRHDAAYCRTYDYDGAFSLKTAKTVNTSTSRVVPSFPEDFGRRTPRNQYMHLTEVTGTQIVDGIPVPIFSVRHQVYDPNGNTEKLRLEERSTGSPPDETVVVYDYRNQPVHITYASTGARITYRYDALGRRIAKLVERVPFIPDYTLYVHDGQREIEEYDASHPGTPVLRARYIYGNRLDEVLAMEQAAPPGNPGLFLVRYYHENSLGSIVGLSDENGVELERYRYDPYGTPIIEGPDYTLPSVAKVTLAGSVVRIEFTESIQRSAFDGLVLIDGVKATSVTFAPPVLVVGTPLIPCPTPDLSDTTLEATPAHPVRAESTVKVLATANDNSIRDLVGNPLAADFGPVMIPYPPPDIIMSAAATSLQPVSLVSAAGPVAHAAAAPTGPELRAVSAVGNPWLFQGRRYDAETGLYYYRARYYAPSTGRFLQNDPKGYVDGPNLYAAFGNNPINVIDSYGTLTSLSGTQTSDVADSLALDDESLKIELPLPLMENGMPTMVPGERSFGARTHHMLSNRMVAALQVLRAVQDLQLGLYTGGPAGLVDAASMKATGLPIGPNAFLGIAGIALAPLVKAYGPSLLLSSRLTFGSFTPKPVGQAAAIIAPLEEGAAPAATAAVLRGAEKGSRPVEGALLPSVSKTLSKKQLRHIENRQEWVDRGKGGYFKSQKDAQSVLDAYHSGGAMTLGSTKQGHIVVQYEGVTGYHNSPGTGFMNQPTNVFMIKGTSSPSVVPISPKWLPP